MQTRTAYELDRNTCLPENWLNDKELWSIEWIVNLGAEKNETVKCHWLVRDKQGNVLGTASSKEEALNIASQKGEKIVAITLATNKSEEELEKDYSAFRNAKNYIDEQKYIAVYLDKEWDVRHFEEIIEISDKEFSIAGEEFMFNLYHKEHYYI